MLLNLLPICVACRWLKLLGIPAPIFSVYSTLSARLLMKLSLSDCLPRRRTAIVLTCLLLAAAPCVVFADSLSDFFRAVKNDDSSTVSALLQRGLSPNLVEENRGETGLILALREDSTKVFNVLINAPSVDLEVRAKNGDNALMIAAYKGNVAAVKALIAKEAEVNKQGWTALHYAATVGNDEIVKILLDESAYIDAESPNS